jgi:phosphotransferase family enzyme
VSETELPDPRLLWPDLAGWDLVRMAETVFHVSGADGGDAYVRADDGSVPLLRRLSAGGLVPAPGVPLHQAAVWRERPADVARIVAAALRSLEQAEVTHGDVCLPNLLGDPLTGELTGIVDWRYAGRFGQEMDVASAVWSCEFNGYEDEVALEVLRRCGWPRVDAEELARLRIAWLKLTLPGQLEASDTSDSA